MGYFLRARQDGQCGVSYRVINSRGPRFLGASPLFTVWAGLYLAAAMIRMLSARLAAEPCLVHVNLTGRGSTIRKIILLSFARALGLRYLLHVHDYDYAHEYRRRSRFLQMLIMQLFRGAAMVVVLGSREQTLLTGLMELPPDRVTVFHNAVPDPLPNLTRARRVVPSCHLLFLGNLTTRKGVPELLHALASPALFARRWRATLAGDGRIEEFRRLAEDLGIGERIDFPGWLDGPRIRALCADADVLVLPSHAEGLAMAVLEGLSHGLAVITTPVGAHAEVIEPEVSGILIPPRDAEALADALARVIDDEGLRRRLGEGARRRFTEKFDVRTYAERLIQLHAGLLSHSRDLGVLRKEHASQ